MHDYNTTNLNLYYRSFKGVSKKTGMPYDFKRYYILINDVFLEVFPIDSTVKAIFNNYVERGGN